MASPKHEIADDLLNTAVVPSTKQSVAMLNHSLREPLLIGLALMFFQECTGINILSYDDPALFAAGGIESPVTATLLTTIGVGFVTPVARIAAFR